jgi:hypothetical protein
VTRAHLPDDDRNKQGGIPSRKATKNAAASPAARREAARQQAARTLRDHTRPYPRKQEE